MTKNIIPSKPFILSNQDSIRLRKQVLEELRYGKRNAIKGNELAYLIGEPNDRRIRVAIQELITEGTPIASSVTEPMGYFIVSNGEEAAEYIRVLKARRDEISKRLEEFQNACTKFQMPEQLSLINR